VVPELGATFPDPTTWSVRMRRARRDEHDAVAIDEALEPISVMYEQALPS
jgi:hypothetical protein